MSTQTRPHTGTSASAESVHPDLRFATRCVPRTLVTATTHRPLRLITRAIGRYRPRDVEVHSLGDGISVRLHRPPRSAVSAASDGVGLLWMHGGGYVIGSAAQDDRLCRAFAHRLGIVVASVDYRLAPRHRFPTPLLDCHLALEWLARQPGIDADRIIVGGASAGGGLAATLALRCRAVGDVTPMFQLLVYPMLDDRTPVRAVDTSRLRVWSPRSNRFGWRSYLGGAHPVAAVPARHENLTGLPPAWIGVGTHDLFHDEDLTYAGRLAQAGVAVTVHTVAGAFHGFDLVAPGLRISRDFVDTQCEVLTTVIESEAGSSGCARSYSQGVSPTASARGDVP